MTYKQTFSHDLPTPEASPKQPQTIAWTAIGALILFSVACYAIGAGSVLRQVFPVACFAVGVILYVRAPMLYMGFTWWLWFLIALIRRLIDYRSGWDEQGVILVTPFLVSLITLATFCRYLPKSYRMGGLPFLMAIFAVSYSFLLGLVNYQPIVVCRTMLDWITPILLGFHIFLNWRDYPKYRQNTLKVFLWCVLITGIYGVVQFFISPDWDRLWLIKTKLTSMGDPKPLGFRIWSTMHSPSPFAIVMMAGLLLLFSSQHKLRILASAGGYLSFLLTTVRSAWGGWMLGLVSLLSTLKPKLQMRLILTILIIITCVVPVVTIEPFASIVQKRLDSFSNLEQDQSYKDRSANYNTKIGIALSSPLGQGMGGTWYIDEDGKLQTIVLDNGFLDMFFTLGWFGAVPYLGSIILLLFKIYQTSESRSDSFANTARSISLAIFSQVIFSSLTISLAGVVFWAFLGLAMAADKYHHHQLTTRR